MTKQTHDENGYEIEDHGGLQDDAKASTERLNYTSAGATRKYPKGHRKYQG